MQIQSIFSNVKSAFDGYTMAQIFYGCTIHCINVYGMKSKADFSFIYRDFIRDHGAPAILRWDNAKEENSPHIKDIQRELLIKDEFIDESEDPMMKLALALLASGPTLANDKPTIYFTMENKPGFASFCCVC